MRNSRPTTSHGPASLSAPLDGGAGLFVCGTAAFGFALVPSLLTLGERELDFDAPVPEIHSRWDKRLALDGSLAGQLSDLVLMHQ